MNGGRSSPLRGGFTLVEVLVVMGVMGILAGLLLPAVQDAREAARATSCRDRLRQMMLATQGFEVANGAFPTTWVGTVLDDSAWGYTTIQMAILPYLGQAALYDSINLRQFGTDEEFLTWNRTAACTSVAVFLCPSDDSTGAQPYGRTSMRVNDGLKEGRYSSNGRGSYRYEVITVGPFDSWWLSANTTGRIRDGLSHTVAFSEKRCASPGLVYDPGRDWLEVDHIGNTVEEFVFFCSNQEVAMRPRFTSGGSWLMPGTNWTTYLHTAVPNTRIPDCAIGEQGIFAARSYHRGQVHAALMDGSVRAYSASISPAVWRALGTRAGGEVVDQE